MDMLLYRRCSRTDQSEMFVDLAVTLLLIVAIASHTCRTCQFPVYLQSSSASEAWRRRDWRARSRSSKVVATPMTLVVDGGTLNWNSVESHGEVGAAAKIYVDHCVEEIDHSAGLYTRYRDVTTGGQKM